MKYCRIVVGLAALMLSGCFDMKQDFEFRGDGTAKITVRLAIDAALIAMSQGGKEPFCGGGLLQQAEKDGVTGSVQQTTEGGDVVCLITVEGKSDTLITAMASGTLMPDDNKDVKERLGYSLTRNGDHYVFLVSIPPIGQKDDPAAQGVKEMFRAAMAGRSLSWSVTAPTILETTGTRSADNKVATFSVPLVEAFFSNTTKTYEFRTVFATEEPGFMGWVKSFF